MRHEEALSSKEKGTDVRATLSCVLQTGALVVILGATTGAQAAKTGVPDPGLYAGPTGVAVNQSVVAWHPNGLPEEVMGPLFRELRPNDAGEIWQDQLRLASLAQPFLAVGKVRNPQGPTCTGTWLGEQQGFTYVLTAAHCVGNMLVPASRVSMSFTGWDDRLVAGGQGWAMVPLGASGKARSDSSIVHDIAVLKLPTQALPSDRHGLKLDPPVLHDGAIDTTDPVNFVGYESFDELSPMGRNWGRTGSLTADDQLMSVQGNGSPENWAIPQAGESGSAWWQHPFGLWSVAAISVPWDWSAPRFVNVAPDAMRFGVRVGPWVDWLRGIFPGVVTLRDRMTVTVGKRFESGDFAVAAPQGTIYFTLPAQAETNGPQAGLWSGDEAYSMIQTTVTDRYTQERAVVRLRGQRDFGCRALSRMEDAVACEGQRKARLIVSFHPEDNPTLKRGSWETTFEVEARGWHRPAFVQRFPLHVRLDRQTEITVTQSQAGQTDSLGLFLALNGGGRFTVPAQTDAAVPGDHGKTALISPEGTVEVTVSDVLNQTKRKVKLRGSETSGRGSVTCKLEGVIPRCSTIDPGLRLSFHREDNADLPSGLYQGKFRIEAVAEKNPNRREVIQVQVRLDTLSSAAEGLAGLVEALERAVNEATRR